MMNKITEEEIQRLIDLHDKNSGTLKSQERQSCWDSGIKVVKNCDCVTKKQYDILFYPMAHSKIKKLQEMFPTLEWLAYLDGEIDRESKRVYIKDLIIPQQSVTAVNVYNVEYGWNEGKNIVGVIHSHHVMGAFFSGIDDEYINQNHDVSIVVSTKKDKEIKGQVRVKTDCDAYYINENVIFSVYYEDSFDHEEFEKIVKDNISDRPSVNMDISGQQTNMSFIIDYGKFNDYLKLSLKDIKFRLLKYYSEEEVDCFIKSGFEDAAEELMVMDQLSDANDIPEENNDEHQENLEKELLKLEVK